MTLKKNRLKNSRLYLILDKSACGLRDLKTILKKALSGGVEIVQFRDKISASPLMIKEAIALQAIARQRAVPFIINDRLDVFLASGADGIHLGQEDLSVKTIRQLIGPSKIIGLSCHNFAQIKKGDKEDTDYLAIGPIFKTMTKPHSAPVGLNTLKNARKGTSKPLFAIGGITIDNLDRVATVKNTGIAICRQVCQNKNPKSAAHKLKQKLS